VRREQKGEARETTREAKTRKNSAAKASVEGRQRAAKKAFAVILKGLLALGRYENCCCDTANAEISVKFRSRSSAKREKLSRTGDLGQRARGAFSALSMSSPST
jgi:hypothetical protein